MQEKIVFSWIAWENIQNLPFPEKVKKTIAQTNWHDYYWQAYGLPYPYAKYSVSDGKELYFQEFPNGEVSVVKEEFTGEVNIFGYFVNHTTDLDENNYFIVFNVIFLKGSVYSVKLLECTPQSTVEYNEQVQVYIANQKKNYTRVSSSWYRWLYRPYFISVHGISYGLIYILSLAQILVSKIANFITPV